LSDSQLGRNGPVIGPLAKSPSAYAACEVLIAEVSGSSFGLGFETGYVLGATAKKVILFYRRDLEKKISLLITGNTHPNCTLAPYSNLTDVESFITSNLSGEPGAAEL
jgi:hypothetical protein